MFQREQDTNGQTWFDRKYFQGIRLKKKKIPNFLKRRFGIVRVGLWQLHTQSPPYPAGKQWEVAAEGAMAYLSPDTNVTSYCVTLKYYLTSPRFNFPIYKMTVITGHSQQGGGEG